ncbi:MAG: SulP family inorganic anion transporter [Patescibacteria group bacterium]|nr:SulP family inorganic anion transporter [Patescibacteria group bacterium]MDE1988554.1 SulP family inorganic anion transporter [Patescibacteria group bacterium]MDE2218615.1 SulP family inorganic anion transporter [Patescibacteria group bacterium]
MKNMKVFLLGNLRRNWKSGITVSLVSIPLSISLAVAANATPIMGIITAFWAGLIASFLGGSNYNIVGPTGALSGILAMFAITYGIASLPALAIMSGIIILIFFVLHFERYIILIPSSVIHGFTLGVAFIIGLNQLNSALGLQGLVQHEKFISNVMESFAHIWQFDGGTAILFFSTLAILFVFLKMIPKIPGPIIVAPIGIFLGYLSEAGIIGAKFQTLHSKFGDIIGSKIFQMPNISFNFLDSNMLKASLAISVVAILETLISAKIADNMTKTKSSHRKEMLGLGFANFASGIFGGIPATAALARTSLNVKSGATSKISATISSIMIGLVSVIFISYFKYLPMAVVASILVYVAFRMVEAEHFKHIYVHNKSAFGLSIVVALITIIQDPIVGILVGSIISLLIFVNHFSKAQSEIIINKDRKMVAKIQTLKFNEIEKHGGDVIVYRFAGQMNYINSQSHLENLSKINGAHTVILNFRNLFYIDVDGLDSLKEIVETMTGKRKKVIITSAGPFIMPVLDREDWFSDMKRADLVFNSTTEALKTLGFDMGNNPAPGRANLAV